MVIVEESDIKKDFELFILNDKNYNKAIDNKIQEIATICKKLNIKINVQNLKIYINKNFEKSIFDNLDMLFNNFFNKINISDSNSILTPFYMTFIVDEITKSRKNHNDDNNSLKLLKENNNNLISKINNIYIYIIIYVITDFILNFYKFI